MTKTDLWQALAIAAAGVLGAGCSASQSIDAAVAPDAPGVSSNDGGAVPTDAGPSIETGTPPDTGVLMDTGTLADTGVLMDTGTLADTGRLADTGTLLDAGACDLSPLERTLVLPLEPSDRGQRWSFWTYFDLDPAVGAVLDRGGSAGPSLATDGSTRTTFIVPTFAIMDEGVDVRAAADGVVEVAVDTFDDRRTERTTDCDTNTNRLVLRTDDGPSIEYASLRQGSLRVAPGDRVAAGDVVAQVGSSECQSWPGLRFRVRDCSGAPVDPFAESLFRVDEELAYAAPMSLIQLVVSDAPFPDLFALRDPPADVPGTTFGGDVASILMLADGQPGDSYSLELLRPEGTVAQRADVVLDQHYAWSWWTWHWLNLDSEGDWLLVLTVNGSEVDRRTYTVTR